MHSVDHALSVIGEKMGQPDLRLNDAGQVELVFADGLTAHISRVAPMAMEMSFQLPRLTHAQPSMMRAMLVANFLGVMSGAGRLAIDPVKEGVLYCERWDVAGMAADDVERRLAEFLEHGAYWLTEGSDRLIAEGEADLIRINTIYERYGEREDEDEDGASARSPSHAADHEEAPILFRL